MTNPSPALVLSQAKRRIPRCPKPSVGVLVCRLRQMREQFGLTLDDVASAVGMSKTGYWEAESGRDVRLTTAFKLATFYGVTVHDLWQEKSNP